MNAISILQDAEMIGAKDFRRRMPAILRNPTHTYRVMLQNKHSVAVLPDHQFVRLLELLQELDGSGMLAKAIRRLQMESKKDYPWFWSSAWQRGHRASKRDIKTGRTKKFPSVAALVRDLNK